MITELILKFEMTASHTLSGYEKPHPHIWKIKTGLTGSPIEGRIVDLPVLRQALEKRLEPFKNTYLNENSHLDPAAREFPTCETLASSIFALFEELLATDFRKQNRTIRLSFVKVTLCEMNGFEQGAARLTAV